MHTNNDCSLTWRLGEGSVKARVVDEGVGHEEEVGDERSNGVQLA